MAPHTGSATPEQIDTLLNFLDEHRDLAVGKLRNIEGKVQAKRLWEELCNTLNSMGGCTKTVQQWQKCPLFVTASQQQRRRRSAAGSDVRSRLFQVEEERAEREILQNRELAGIRSELAGIKAELSQMSGLMREYLNNKNK
ncbi:hypothetical protein ACJJTC_005498 [Scirpophaga incertulas]